MNLSAPLAEALRAATPEALAALANLGLVKRATREIADGAGPELVEESAGIVGKFPDGTVATLPADAATPLLKATRCTCGAPLCRHRVALLLAARATLPVADAVEAPAPIDPAALDDATLREAFGAIVDAAFAARPGAVVFVAGGPVPFARAAGAVVRFLAPGVAGARCDCVEGRGGRGCVHVIHAVWAFREGPVTESERRVHWPAAVAPIPASVASRAGAGPRVLAAVSGLVAHLVQRGVQAGGDALAAAALPLHSAAEEEGYRFLRLCAADVVAAADAWSLRSATYDAAAVAALAGELLARARAPRDRAPDALGLGLPGEVRLGKIRLVALGARVAASGEERRVQVVLADPEGGAPVLFERAFPDEARPLSGPELAHKAAIPRVPLRALAEGQLLTEAAIRTADGTLRLLTGRGVGATSVLPQAGDWGRLPPSLLRTRAFAEEEYQGLFLGARTRLHGLVVLGAPTVEHVGFSPGEQAIVAVVRLDGGPPITVLRRHSPLAPHALSALAAALPRARYLAGTLRAGRAGLVLDPLSVVADDAVIVPDFAAKPGPVDPLDLPEAAVDPSPRTPLAPLVTFAAELVHSGLFRARERLLRDAAAAQEALTRAGAIRAASILAAWIAAPEDVARAEDLLLVARAAAE